MGVSAHDVAAELRRRIPALQTVKLHKLLYYCQGHHEAAFGEPLFSETISAWDMGPVVGQVWWVEKGQGPLPARPSPLNEAQLNTIGYVVSRYGKLSGNDLYRLTHSERPWIDADVERKRTGRSSVKIDNDRLRAFFVADANEEDDAWPPVDGEQLAEWLAGAEHRRHADLHADSPGRLRALIQPST
jgi:uncharacterized phage-associated protein